MDKEYLMLRSEIEESLKKQDKVFGTIISILGLTNVFSYISENLLFLFLILFLSTLLQLRMLEYRNTVYYISTYMSVFLEKDSDFKWETRLRKFKKEGYRYENGKLRSKIINSMVIRFGRVIKHFIILGLATFIVFRIVVNVYKSYYVLWVKLVLYAVTVLFVVFNFLYTYTLSTDKVNYDTYLKRWEKLREEENETRIESSDYSGSL